MIPTKEDSFEKKFRKYNGDTLTDRILLHTSQMFDYPFWMREQTACHDDPDIAYQVAMNLEKDRENNCSSKIRRVKHTRI
jgi:hypothetical protein